DGTEESHQRMQAALEAEWPYVEELFGPVDGAVVDPGALRDAVLITVESVLAEATLEVPQVPPAHGGGRRGLHTEELGYLLAEMQHLHRSHPGATW
ncbi:MAG TPA: Phenylacetic acid catabolic protein, partial [Marmoricola sp.]